MNRRNGTTPGPSSRFSLTVRRRLEVSPDRSPSNSCYANANHPGVMHMDAVGTILTDRPPHRTVRALLRIRLPPWMSGEEAGGRIRMQNTWSWKPLREDREVPIPRDSSLTAAAENEPPQSPQALPEDT